MKDWEYKKLKNAKILVTGGAGFIGSHLTERLLELGAKVIVVDNFSTGKKENLKNVLGNKNLKIIKCDVNDFKQIKKVFKKNKIDCVFHYAAVVGVKRLEEEPLKILNDIEGIKNILNLSLKYKIKKLIFASSSEVYGEPVSLPEKEEGVHNPRDVYALVKLIGENLIKIYYEKYGFPGCALRFFNVYGPKQESSPYGFVVGIFMKQVLSDQRPTIFGDGLQTRDFMYVKDNVEASIRALLNKKTDGQIINIGTGRQITILDLAKKIINLSGKNLKPKFLPKRKLDIRYRCPDVTKMKKILKFVPKYSLEKGLKETFEWYRKNLVY
ncbi:MAG: SDR family NAD(P)-dependent oxidoreductase [candidate division WOR-3 bacterium]